MSARNGHRNGRDHKVRVAIVGVGNCASSLVQGPDDSLGLSPEHRRILGLCRGPATVADVASTTALPLGVVRVLIADLMGQGRITVLAARPVGEEPSTAMLKEVLNGLRAL